MIHFPLLTFTLAVPFEEAAHSRLLTGSCVGETFILQLLLRSIIVLNRANLRVLRDVEVVVEVAAIGTEPRERPTHAFLVGSNLLNGGAGDADEGRVTRVKVFQGNDVVGTQGAGRASRVPFRSKHEMLHDELAAAVEEVRKAHTDLFAGVIEAGECVRLGHLNHWESTTVGDDRVVSTGQRLLFLEESDAGGLPFGRLYYL